MFLLYFFCMYFSFMTPTIFFCIYQEIFSFVFVLHLQFSTYRSSFYLFYSLHSQFFSYIIFWHHFLFIHISRVLYFLMFPYQSFLGLIFLSLFLFITTARQYLTLIIFFSYRLIPSHRSFFSLSIPHCSCIFPDILFLPLR